MERNRKLIGMALIVVSVLSVLSWERFGRNRFLYEEVLVLNRNVSAGTIITEDLLRTERMENPPAGALKSTEKKQVLGKESVQSVHKGAPVFAEDFAEQGMATGAKLNRYVLELPEAWIASMPREMARGAMAVLVLNGQETARVRVLRVKDAKTLEVLASLEQVKKISEGAQRGDRYVVLEG